MTTVYKNTVLEKVATVPGFAAKQGEDGKFLADRTSSQPISAVHGGPHILVLFAIEDGGRLGAHAQALLRSLASAALAKGRTPPFARGVERFTHKYHADFVVGAPVAAALVCMGTSDNLSSCRASPLPSSGSSTQPPLG